MNVQISDFLKEKILNQYTKEDAARIIDGFCETRKTTLRINRLRSNGEQIRKTLSDAGFTVQDISWYEDALLLPDTDESQIQELLIYSNGSIYLQSLSSMIPPLLLEPEAGENILDMAAAPGGKTTEIASLTEDKAMITACERNAGRAERLKYNLQKQGVGHATVLIRDARTLEEFYRFDRILLDAPCSGSGTVNPGTKGVFSKENLKKTTKIQQDLLRKASQLLPKGHRLVYSTCSILKEENEGILNPLLSNGTFQIVPIDMERFKGVPQLPVNLPGTMCVCPTREYEGFFAACLVRK